MRIDAASLQLPLSSRSRTVAPVRPGAASEERASTPSPVVSIDWTQRAKQAEERAYYATNQALPFSGREAIALYQQNSSLNLQPGDAELMGVDLYA